MNDASADRSGPRGCGGSNERTPRGVVVGRQSGPQKHRPRKGRWGEIYSAVDLGTNSCRLLIAKPARDGFRIIDAFSRIVRLGEGLSATGVLSDAAIERTLDALKVCVSKMRRRGTTRARNVATEACRRARNCDMFVKRVRDQLALDLEIITPAEEARLAVAGCRTLLDRNCRYALVFDIGGGSTELMWLELPPGRMPKMLAWTSLPYGVVSLSERYGGIEVGSRCYEVMVERITALLEPFEREHCLATRFRAGQVQLLGTSGTVTTLAGMHLGLERYDRSKVDGRWVLLRDVSAVSERLLKMTHAERAAEPCVGPDRADLVVAGCAILEAINRSWPCQRLRVADRGLREGMLMALMDEADRGSPAFAWPGAEARARPRPE